MSGVSLQYEKTYDLVFWTSIQKHTSFLIPLINEAFGGHFSEGATVRLLSGKQATKMNDESLQEGEMDALAEIVESQGDQKGGKYHFELQSWPDGTMAIRMAEYGVAAAYDSIVWDGMTAEMTIPHTAVIFLRSNDSTLDIYSIVIHHPGGEAAYEVPVLKLRNYTIDDIFKKKLLLLLPYIPFLFEDRFGEMNGEGGSIEDLRGTLDDVNDRLDAMIQEGELDETKKNRIIDWLKRVFDKLTIKYTKVQEGVDEIMNGYILHTRTDDIFDQGMQKGMQQGRKEDAIRMHEDGLPVERIARYVDESVETVKGWIASSPVPV